MQKTAGTIDNFCFEDTENQGRGSAYILQVGSRSSVILQCGSGSSIFFNADHDPDPGENIFFKEFEIIHQLSFIEGGC